MTKLAGCGTPGFGDGHGYNAMFKYPRLLCFSQFHDCLFLCDGANHRIRRINLTTGINSIYTQLLYVFYLTNTGIVSSIGSGRRGFKDGKAEEAEFNYPTGISPSESDGSLLVCDHYNHKIRKITFEGIVIYFNS